MSDPAETYRTFLKCGGVADLSARVKLRITGADRVRYLNGQTTADVQRLAPGIARPACITTAKGRLCADVFIHATADALFVDADAALRDTLPARLERYIIADDVMIEDVTDTLHLLHLGGIAATRTDLRISTDAPRANRLGCGGVDLWLDPSVFENARDALTDATCALDEELLEALRIEAGIPRWGRDLDEDTLPPEAGLDRTHIDYDKGCYIGQEVISRLKSVGHVNRSLTGFIALDHAPLAPGLRIFAPDDDTREIGSITSAAWSFALEKHIGLGYLKRGSATGELLARPAGGTGPQRRLLVQNLPLVP